MAKPRSPTAVDCNVCGKSIGRRADLARHMKLHAPNKDQLKHACPYDGCLFRTLQRSNLIPHLNTHSRERPYKCPTAGCAFDTSDPGSLTRHRKEIHGYEPKAKSRSHPSAVTRKEARQKRRVSPYTTSSSTSDCSSGHSLSPLERSLSKPHSPCPQLPQIPHLSPPASLCPLDNHINEGSKNFCAAYNTNLITNLPEDTDSLVAPNPGPEGFFPLIPRLPIISEAPVYPRLSAPEQVGLHAIDMPAQPVLQTNPDRVSDAALEQFLALFDDWNTKVAPAHATAILPAPAVQYPIDYTLLPTLPSLPSYEVQRTVNDTPYEPCGYPATAAAYDPLLSQPCSFATPEMGICRRSAHQTPFYTAPAATSGFPMQGLYLY